MNKSAATTSEQAAREKMMWSLLEAARAQEERLEGALGEVGLSSPRLSVLTELVKSTSPLPLSELAARLSCVRSNITQLVDRLEADGLVRRVHDATDRRSIRAEITPSGRERQAAGAERLERVQAEFAERLSGVDGSALQEVLSALQ
jgi:DNA-binding MarR family transcriptional regulator